MPGVRRAELGASRRTGADETKEEQGDLAARAAGKWAERREVSGVHGARWDYLGACGISPNDDRSISPRESLTRRAKSPRKRPTHDTCLKYSNVEISEIASSHERGKLRDLWRRACDGICERRYIYERCACSNRSILNLQ